MLTKLDMTLVNVSAVLLITLLLMGCSANKQSQRFIMDNNWQMDDTTIIDHNEGSTFVPYDEPPTIIGKIVPVYPAQAKRRGMQGTVVLEVEIKKDGFLADISVLRSAGEILDNAAIQAGKKVRFVPAKSSGNPVDSSTIIPIAFSLY